MSHETLTAQVAGTEADELIIRTRSVKRVVSKHAHLYSNQSEGSSESGEGEAGEGSSEGGSNN